MPAPGATEERREHLRCRHLVWEASPEDGKTVPSRYCENPFGVFHLLDCPVYQGGRCAFFEPRPEGEEPAARSGAEVEALRARLSEDYLRWSYWRRVESLPGGDRPEPRVVAPEPSPEEEPGELAPSLASASPEEEALEEKYPGQRRSEDRRLVRKGTPEPEAIEKVLEEAGPEAPAPAPERPGEATGGAAPAGPGRASRKGRGRRRKRRGRRRRGGGGARPA